MISRLSRLTLENFKTLKGVQREEIDGELKEKEVDVSLRFDFSIPIGVPYDVCYEVLNEFIENIKELEASHKKESEEKKEESES